MAATYVGAMPASAVATSIVRALISATLPLSGFALQIQCPLTIGAVYESSDSTSGGGCCCPPPLPPDPPVAPDPRPLRSLEAKSSSPPQAPSHAKLKNPKVVSRQCAKCV